MSKGVEDATTPKLYAAAENDGDEEGTARDGLAMKSVGKQMLGEAKTILD